MTSLKPPDSVAIPITIEDLGKRARLRFENNLFQSVVENHLTTSVQASRLGDYKMDMFDALSSYKFAKVSKKTIKLAYDIINMAPSVVDAISYELEQVAHLDTFYKHIFPATSLLIELKEMGIIKKRDDFLEKIESGLTYYFKTKDYDKALTLSYYLDLNGLLGSFEDILDEQEDHIESFRYFLFIHNALKGRKIAHSSEVATWIYKELAVSLKQAAKAKDGTSVDKIIKLIPSKDLSLVLARIAKKFGFKSLLHLKDLLDPSKSYYESLDAWVRENKCKYFSKAIKNHDMKEFLCFCEHFTFEEVQILLDAYKETKERYLLQMVEACSFIYDASKRLPQEFMAYQIKLWIQKEGEAYGFHLKL